MRMRIEADAELSPEEATAVRAALERYAAAANREVSACGQPSPWARAARALGGEAGWRTGGREEWQAARDRRRRTREAAT
jgi:hypothetical protein